MSLKLRTFSWVLFFLLITRLLAMYAIPLNDTTEARYGEIARIMQETGNWITPMHQYGEPFWAKPPLSIWLSALSMKCFGINELAARLPGLLLSISILILIFGLVKHQSGEMSARWSVLILASSIYFFLDAGTVMTDPTLLFCITLTLVAFWRGVVFRSKPWGYIFFVALGLGLLAKGPVAVILPGLPIFVWVLWRRQWRILWQQLPWFCGGFLTLLIALPWYLLAESKTPGFLNYFLLGENIQRFLQPSWSGDKYGYVHHVAYGMIWFYALAGIFPWSLHVVVWLMQHGRQIPSLCRDNDGWMLYLVLCTIVPFIFFTFARNIIYPYVFPSLPSFAMMFVEMSKRSHCILNDRRSVIGLSLVSGMIFVLVTTLFVLKPECIGSSQQRVVHAFDLTKSLPTSQLIYWAPKVDYSAQFYSKGHAISTLDATQLNKLLRQHPEDMVVVNTEDMQKIPPVMLKKLDEVAVIPVLKKRYRLMRLAHQVIL